jgi:hypothetical protein
MQQAQIGSRKNCLWIFAGGMVGIAVFFIVALLGLFTRAASDTQSPATPVLVVVERPTSSPTAQATVTMTPPPVETGVSTSLPPSAPGLFAEGNLVQVYGTGGDGLRLRSLPGLDARIEFLGLENEVFEIADGPVEKDGYQWWYLVNPYDASKVGWAVANYLRSVAGP